MSDPNDPMDANEPSTPNEPGQPDASAPEGASPDADLMPTKDERNMALLAHLLGIILSVLGPLIIWLIKKDESAYVDDQGKEALNFQITALIGWVIMVVIGVVTCGVGAFLWPVYWIAVLVFCILAAMKASEGVRYRYPLTIRLIK